MTEPPLPAPRLRVAVAGANGFVGRALVAALSRDCDVIALGRGTQAEGGARAGVEWRRCDLFSLREVEAALAGCDVGVYLVHSMMPSARLTQARFEDLDLVLADNFGRAAARQSVGRIVYLGGLVPPDAAELSPHLRSRLEVERALAAHGTKVSALRAGLVVGAGGSSLRILMRLVGRLPVMLCPRWTGTLTQPIALEDTVALLAAVVRNPKFAGRVCEIGGPDVLSYRDMMRETARVLHRRRLLIPVPFMSPSLSRLWVSLVTRTPLALVRPLVESLRHPMVARDRWLQRELGLDGEPFRTALERAADGEQRARATKALPASASSVSRTPTVSTVRSMQRLPLPPGDDASAVAHEYMAWVTHALRPILRVERDGERCVFHARWPSRALLELSYRPERSSADRALFEVTGGVLADLEHGSAGRLEFRVTPDGEHVLAGVHDFRPCLPWYLYALTQAPLHLLVMRRFGRHLARRGKSLRRGPLTSGAPL